MKKNECFFTVTGRHLWDGRYCCVLGAVLYYNETEDQYYILVNQRGPGCPDEVGKWNMPCGYLDAGSGEENIAREVFEETGVKIDPALFEEVGHGDLSKSRNVTFRYIAQVDHMYQPAKIEDLVGGELNEVSDIKWIPENEIDNYQWAFNHKYISRELISMIK